MKKKIFSIVAIAALIALPMSVMGQDAATSLSNTRQTAGKVKIISPISFQKNADLDFGTIASSDSSFTATAAASNATTLSSIEGALQLVKGQSASFTVGGEVGNTYKITIPTGSLTLSGGTGTVTISSFSCSKATDGTTAISSTGNDNIFYVGGILTANKAHGTFSGNFNVTVNYN